MKMKVFIIQARKTIYGLMPAQDFGFTLIQAIDWWEWYYGCEKYNFILSETVPNKLEGYMPNQVVPVGSVEFVHAFIDKYRDVGCKKPLNIPKELMQPEYLKRKVWVGNISENNTNKRLFVKDNTKVKGFTDILAPGDTCPLSEYLISEVIPIHSEWRCFVYNGMLLDIKNYQGDFARLPSIPVINKMIRDFSRVGAYTLDVGVNEEGTFIIEAHPFYSCGLYGFEDYQKLPLMLISGWNQISGFPKQYSK